jgi:site-specific DNA recombinase
MDGYIRVSRRMGREGPGYISPSVQRTAIEKWADYRSIKIVAWHEDEDQSGGTQNRPGLREAMRRVEARETDGIACWRLNRFARNVVGAIADVERIQAIGGHLAFVEEDIDPTGPFGSFILTVLLAVATLERDNMIAGWQTATRRAIERGVKISPTPYGYQRTSDGTLTPDPLTSPHVIEAYHLSAAQGITAAYQYLSEHAPGRAWAPARVRRMLGYRTYLGESRRGDLINAEAHAPLVTRAIWEAAQHDPSKTNRAPGVFPLSGLAICGTCGSPMVGGRSGPNLRTYRCHATQTNFRGKRCAKGAYILAEPLETYVRDAMRPLIAPYGVEKRDANTDALTLAERALTEAEAELDAFAADLTLRRVLKDRYHEHLTARGEAVEQARAEYRRLAQHQNAREQFSATDVLDGDDQRLFGEFLRSILTSIVVAHGRGTPQERVTINTFDDDMSTGPAPSPNPE